MTPEAYLPILMKRLSERFPEVKLSRRYVDGDAPLPEMGKNLLESWVAFQKKARTNYGGRTCQSLVGRIRPVGVRVTDPVAADVARRYWRDNRLGTVFEEAIWNAIATGYGYVLTQVVDGRPVPTSERPEQMITIPDPLQPWRAIAALKAWRDTVTEVDYATVWVPGIEHRFSRSAKNENGMLRKLDNNGWESISFTEFEGGVPVHAFENEHRVAEVTPHRDVIDRINTKKLQRLATEAMQAWRQRVLEGDLPDEDDDGNAIDYSKTFEAAPGAIWDLPAGVTIKELSDGSAGIMAMLKGEENDVREYCGVTGTPMSAFMSDSQNQSAEGAMNAKEGEIAKAEKRISLFRPSMEGAILDALRVYGVDTSDTIEVEFAPPAYVSWNEKAQASSQANGTLSRRWIARNIWGLSEDDYREMETDLATERLELLTLAGGDGAGGQDISAMGTAFDSLGKAIRAGVSPDDAAGRLGLDGLQFTGATPVALRLPEREAQGMEER